jgi:uncharacterized protein YoxC
MTENRLNVIPAEEITKRFDKIEVKLDRLSDAMIALARNEEKLSSLEDQVNNLQARVNRHSEKLDTVAESAAENSRTVQNINKLVWVVIVAVASVLVKSFMP